MSFTVIQPRRNTRDGAKVSNPILAIGERGYETDTGRWKTGNGSTAWNSLPYDKADVLGDTVARQKVQVTNNCYMCANDVTAAAAANGATTRLAYLVGINSTDIQLAFSNTTRYAGPPVVDQCPTTSISFSAAIEDTGGVIMPVTFAGKHTVTLDGGCQIVSDPLPIELLAGQQIWVRVCQSSGTFTYNRVSTGATGTGGYCGGDQTNPSGAAAASFTTAFAGCFAPCAIIGTPTDPGTPKAVVLQGDSITLATQDSIVGWTTTGQWSPNLNIAGGGYLMRALAGQAGILQQAFGSDLMTWYLANAGHYRRGFTTRWAKYAVIAYGENDVNGSRTAAQLQTDLLTQATRNFARGVLKNVIVTITPYTTSTDLWATTGNQTTASSPANTVRIAHNTWVRDGGPIDPVTKAPVATGTVVALRFGDPLHPIAGYLDVAAAVETSLNSTVWKAANRTVTDAAITSGQATLTSVTAAWTSADVGRTVVVAGAASGSAVLQGTIQSVAGNVATLYFNAGTTVTGARCTIDPYTVDGLHPAPAGHAAIAAAVQSTLLALLS